MPMALWGFGRNRVLQEREQTLVAFFAMAFVALWPDAVFAQTLGTVICNLQRNYAPFSPLINAIAYVIGALFVFRGALYLKRHTDNANENPIQKGVGHMLAGGALAALPITAKVLQETLHINPQGPGGVKGCDPGGVTGGAVALDQMMRNFVENIHGPMFYALSVLCFVMGAFFVTRGLMRAAKSGTDPRAGDPKGVIATLLIGAVLMSVAGMFTTMMNTLFNTGNIRNFSTLINWSQIAGEGVNTAAVDLTVKSILMFVQIIGAIAFIRGWLIVKNAVEGAGQATVPQGITHILGGTMALNIGLMIEIFDRTFGTNLVNNN